MQFLIIIICIRSCLLLWLDINIKIKFHKYTYYVSITMIILCQLFQLFYKNDVVKKMASSYNILLLMTWQLRNIQCFQFLIYKQNIFYIKPILSKFLLETQLALSIKKLKIIFIQLYISITKKLGIKNPFYLLLQLHLNMNKPLSSKNSDLFAKNKLNIYGSIHTFFWK